MPRPFELTPEQLRESLDEMVRITISDLVSEFLLMPKGSNFLEYPDFRDAYEVLRQETAGFTNFTTGTIYEAVLKNSRAFGVLRAILGMTSPEWAELVRTEYDSDISQNAARSLDRDCRESTTYVKDLEDNYKERADRYRASDRPLPAKPKPLERLEPLIRVAAKYISEGDSNTAEGVIHRLAKFDTKEGLESLQYAAREAVPYAMLLYERYLGRPFATHRDAVSELVGEVMENAVEERLRAAGVPYRKTKRAERIPGFGQAPDFCIPDEVTPIAVIEAKITSDDGTARDKVTRIKALATQRDKHIEQGSRPYEVVACIDGRGFRQRREDMRQLLLELDGKVFTTASLDQLTVHTRIRELIIAR